jgi:predicted metal-binding membrane protein
MTATSGMAMHHGMTSMPWMHLHGSSWAGATSSFLGMWVAMTVAMMLPSLAPTLWRYHRAFVGERRAAPSGATLVVAAGYLAAWTTLGVAVIPLGVVLAAAGARLPLVERATPIAGGVVVLLAGALQHSAWKARHLARCRETPAPHATRRTRAGTAWRYGLHLGRHCVMSCAGPMASLFAIGLMDLRAMAVVTTVITIERLAPAGERVARATGMIGMGAGLVLIVRASGHG